MKQSHTRWRALVASTIGLLLLCSVVMVPSVAPAATEEEWEAFRTDVAEKCTVEAEILFETMEIMVDPFGSQQYGLALIRGKARGADVQISAICVYDKETQTAEIGSELPDVVWARGPVESP